MTNYDLLKILGNIDRKYYDEALGGAPEKPLKIDVSRKPVGWYRIAAPAAACLVAAAGVVIAVPRIIDAINVNDPITSLPTISEPANTSDPTSSMPAVSEPTVISEPRGYYDDYPLFSGEDIPLYASFDDVIDLETANTISVTKYGDYDVCISAENIFCFEHPLDNRSDYAKNICLNLVKDNKRISYARFPTPPASGNDRYDYEISPDRADIDNKSGIEIYELNGSVIAAALLGGGDNAGAFFSIKDEKITLLRGTDITGESLGALNLSEKLTANGSSVTDNENGREYRFDLDTLDNISDDTPNFSTHFTGISGEIVGWYGKWLYSENEFAGTEKDAQDFRNYLNDLEKFSLVIELYEDTEKVLTAQQASDVVELIATAKLIPSKYAQSFGGISDSVNLIDENGNCIVTIWLHGNLHITYNDKTFYFEVESDLRQKLYDAVDVELTDDQQSDENLTASGNVNADEEDIQNWKDFISTAQLSRVEAIYSVDMQTESTTISNINEFTDILRSAEPKIIPLDENPWTGGFPLYFHAYDMNGDRAFDLTYSTGGSGWVTVLYEENGLSYTFSVREDEKVMNYFSSIETKLDRQHGPW